MGKRGASIVELERALAKKRQAVEKLMAKRDTLLASAAAIDRQIGSIKGQAGPGRPPGTKSQPKPGAPKPRARRKHKALAQVVLEVLAAAGKEMTVKEITQGVEDAGYKSKSKNLSNIIGQFLGSSDGVERVVRGVYRAKA